MIARIIDGLCHISRVQINIFRGLPLELLELFLLLQRFHVRMRLLLLLLKIHHLVKVVTQHRKSQVEEKEGAQYNHEYKDERRDIPEKREGG